MTIHHDRLAHVDLLKGIGIILMVMGHVSFGTLFDHLIHGFHMPLFFVVSGYLFRHRERDDMSTIAYIRHKAKSLLVPYFIINSMYYILYSLKNGFSIKPLYHVLWKNTHDMPVTGALWFLTALFLCDVVYFLFDRYLQERHLFHGAIWGLTILGLCLNDTMGVELPWAGNAALVGLGIFDAGFIFRRSELCVQSHMYKRCRVVTLTTLISIGSVVGLFCIMCNTLVNMRESHYGNGFLFLCGALLISSVGMLLAELWISWGKTKWLNRLLCFIGEESIVFLCLNQPICRVLRLVDGLTSIPLQIIHPLILVLTIMILCIISLAVRTTIVKKAFGK